MPSGTFAAIAGDALRRLKDWISAGGTLITIAEASRWAARENVGLLGTTTELRGGKPDVEAAEKPGDKKDGAAQPIDLDKAILPERERPDALPGALLRAALDTEHWLAAGTDGEIQVMVEGSRTSPPIKLDKGRNVGVYGKADSVVASGMVWEDLRPSMRARRS